MESYMGVNQMLLESNANSVGVGQATLKRHFGSSQFSVVCRIRPVLQSEITSKITIYEGESTIAISGSGKNSQKVFQFNNIFQEHVKQNQFTKELCNQIYRNYEIDGRGSLILSYGVTNSGKTFTILGTEDEPGILPIIIETLEIKFPGERIEITAIENYNDEFYSLKDRKKLYPKESWGSYDFDEYIPEVITIENTKEMVLQFMVNRNQNETKYNKKSSRSHAIFKVQCQDFSIAIVDLAGSERSAKANTNFHESNCINSSLLVLGKCIHAFKDGNMIPFRQCKLTRALMEYFGLNFKIYMIAHVNRSVEMFHQNSKVLEYAALSCKIKTINVGVNPSIIKTARKKFQEIKSAKKIKIVESGNESELESKSCIDKLSQKQSEIANKYKSIKKIYTTDWEHEEDKNENIESDSDNQEQNQLRKKCITDEIKKYNRRKQYEAYINKMIGSKSQFDFYLEKEFQKEDEKDKKFIHEINCKIYKSPSRYQMAGLLVEKSQLEAKIQIRKQILSEIQIQKKNKLIDCQTYMGPSMRKCFQVSKIKERVDQQIEIGASLQKNVQAFEELNKLLELSEKKGLQTPQKVNQQFCASNIEEKQKLSQEDESFLRKAMKSPMQMFKSGCKIIKQAADTMGRSLIDIVNKSNIKNKQKMESQLQTRFRMKIFSQFSIDIMGLPHFKEQNLSQAQKQKQNSGEVYFNQNPSNEILQNKTQSAQKQYLKEINQHILNLPPTFSGKKNLSDNYDNTELNAIQVNQNKQEIKCTFFQKSDGQPIQNNFLVNKAQLNHLQKHENQQNQFDKINNSPYFNTSENKSHQKVKQMSVEGVKHQNKDKFYDKSHSMHKSQITHKNQHKKLKSQIKISENEDKQTEFEEEKELKVERHNKKQHLKKKTQRLEIIKRHPMQFTRSPMKTRSRIQKKD